MLTSDNSQDAIYHDGQVHLDGPVDWPDGTRLVVSPVFSIQADKWTDGHVIIVGFGLAGRYVADLLDTRSCLIRLSNGTP